MSWASGLFGRGRREPAQTAQPARPAAGNPIHAWLDAAGVPWRLARAELAERFGVVRDPLFGEAVIELDVRPPPVEGLLRPLSARGGGDLAPFAPATEISGVAWFGEDARANLRRVAGQLEPALGQARVTDEYNTVTCGWTSGPASVSLVAWPPDLQSGSMGPNPAQDAEPRLATACHLYVKTGLRLAATAAEAAWLDGFEAIAELPAASRTAAAVRNAAAIESELQFVREPGPGVERILGRIGLSADRQALIFCASQLCIVRLRDLARFELQRILPAKGGGGAYLQAVCRAGRRGHPEISLTLASGSRPNDLDQLAQTLAAATGKPLRASESYDV